MKQVVIKKIGWRDRTPEERAEAMRKLGDLLLERRKAHERLKELAPLIGAARRAPSGKVRAPKDVLVEFDGIKGPKVAGWLADNNDPIVRLALKQLNPFKA